MNNIRVGYAMCGSFCTLKSAISQLKALSEQGYDIYPIMSPIVYSTDTRFGSAEDFRSQVTKICGREIIHTIVEAEPIGPKALLDILVVAPCTGNTAAKIANGITDTAVCMAAKAHMRNCRPVLLAMATNDALAASAKNIGSLMNTKNIYFVPLVQDDPAGKPTSLVADFSRISEAVTVALDGKQLRPLLF